MGFTKKKKVESRKNNIRRLHDKCDKNSVLLRLHLQKTSHACSHRIYKNGKWENGFVRRWLIMARSTDCINQCRIHLFFVVNSLCSQSHSITCLYIHIFIYVILIIVNNNFYERWKRSISWLLWQIKIMIETFA